MVVFTADARTRDFWGQMNKKEILKYQLGEEKTWEAGYTKLIAVFKLLLGLFYRLAERNKGNARFKNYLCIYSSWVFEVAWQVGGCKHLLVNWLSSALSYLVKSCHLWCHYWLAVRGNWSDIYGTFQYEHLQEGPWRYWNNLLTGHIWEAFDKKEKKK